MKLSWNILGVAVWILIIVGLFLVIQHIRKRHIKMIVMEHKTFSWPNFLFDFFEIALLLVATVFMLSLTFLSNPKLTDKTAVDGKVTYHSLILTPHETKSYYVKANASEGDNPLVTFDILSEGKKLTLSSKDSSISYGQNPLSNSASAYPFSKSELVKKDVLYQKAYLAAYEARYNDTWYNGLGLNVGKMVSKYYLIRIPDATFVSGDQTQVQVNQ